MQHKGVLCKQGASVEKGRYRICTSCIRHVIHTWNRGHELMKKCQLLCLGDQHCTVKHISSCVQVKNMNVVLELVVYTVPQLGLKIYRVSLAMRLYISVIWKTIHDLTLLLLWILANAKNCMIIKTKRICLKVLKYWFKIYGHFHEDA